MIGKCPHCQIELKRPPFKGRETNEMLVVMNYRKFMDTGNNPRSLDEIGYCEVCNASPQEIKEQKRLNNSTLTLAQ